MSTYNPPTLEKLALDALLRKDAINSSNLDHLPTVLFPPLFLEAFNGRHTEILKAMVAAWPFPCLPVGALMKTPDVEVFQAVLDGIDILLTQNVSPRIRKLQVLDLRDVHQEFWDVCAGRKDEVSSAKTGNEKHVAKHIPRYALRQRLKVITDLSLGFCLQHQIYLLKWAQQRKQSLRLCCLKMKICHFSVESIREILNIFQPNYIEELEIYTKQVLSFLGCFAPCFGQMRNLRKFHLREIRSRNSVGGVLRFADVKNCAAKFLSQFSKLNYLQHFCMNGDFFSSDNMKQLFRCLKSPLESLSMTVCQLSKSDLKQMSECQRLHQLKHLHFDGVVFPMSCSKSLRILLENVSDTLQTLQLENCRMNDSQLNVLLPALGQCSQLTSVNFYENDFSTAVMEDLLQCMANQSKLIVEHYPAPLECYDHEGYLILHRFSQLCRNLMDTLMARRQPKTITFATKTCRYCRSHCIYDKETRLCRCWQ
ncbi:PRAME family member 8-like [Apodemus sylvaticus]|uniref:PRAME family member 8-like n=1 Tax=Apodemus sylvaticus TaxID=10129 RepID=UPI002243EC61|nr:PRAME family member 8-like [Apodemus sylvaticus]